MDQGECHRCENNCMICWTNTNCDNCMTGYVGSECRNFCDGCERDCSPGYFFNDGKCVACPDNCETCLTDTECDKCIDGYWGSLCQYPCSICKDSDCTMCSEVCPDGLYLSSLGQCINCPNNCRKCTDTAVCTECQVGFMGTICQDRICAFNEYFKEYDDNNRCVNCPTNCHSCTDSLNCITCKDGYFGNLCQHNCTGCIDTCEAKTGCTGQCTSGFFKPVSTTHNIFPNANVQFCEKCPNDCKSCISSSECDKCAEGSWGMMCEQFCNSGCSQNKCEDKSGRCLMGCNAGWSGEKCNIRCNTGCVQCDRRNYEICTTCESGYFGELCERTCSSNCKLPSVERASVCTIQSGACLWGCQPTWWGKLCENKCSFFCNSSECNMDDGSCEHGCIDGYTGTFCSRGNYKFERYALDRRQKFINSFHSSGFHTY